MIKGTSLTSSDANIETMFIYGETVAGSGDIFTTDLVYADLNETQKTTYDEGVAVVSGSYWTTITNTTSELEINRVTSEILVQTPSEIDFDTLSEADKDKLRNLLALFVELKN